MPGVFTLVEMPVVFAMQVAVVRVVDVVAVRNHYMPTAFTVDVAVIGVFPGGRSSQDSSSGLHRTCSSGVAPRRRRRDRSGRDHRATPAYPSLSAGAAPDHRDEENEPHRPAEGVLEAGWQRKGSGSGTKSSWRTVSPSSVGGPVARWNGSFPEPSPITLASIYPGGRTERRNTRNGDGRRTRRCGARRADSFCVSASRVRGGTRTPGPPRRRGSGRPPPRSSRGGRTPGRRRRRPRHPRAGSASSYRR